MTEEAEDKRQNVKSLLKMLAVLECFSATDRELSVLQIAQRTGLPRTTVHRLVDSLRTVGFLDQEASRERYRLGLKLFELGTAAITNLPLYREAGPFVDTLAKLSGEIVHLCIFDGSRMVFVEQATDKARANNVVTTMEGTPCHSTGVGKAALAFQPPAVIERVIGLGLQPFTRNTIVDPERLRGELADIRARGYAIDNCEHEPEVRCVAAPIRNSTGRVIAAISVSGNTRHVTPERVPELAELVLSHAQLISVQLGYQPPRERPAVRDEVERPRAR
ncbi:transcriptional regulator, IclR family [Enhydrobacter aerosaccus]|uniref:Transcriptional regulator, IclR family n=1 Tax=Enhydrobacter aerosaccus TaxID=225324 RepID=A0A1T4TEZ5_9HYPH|nr:IclR family transcriptional regulator [Enhydrobacter aerosaccus]SKA38808.1 transcriptional regulator, IclR family [Enhydrobacter aerosaccus]